MARVKQQAFIFRTARADGSLERRVNLEAPVKRAKLFTQHLFTFVVCCSFVSGQTRRTFCQTSLRTCELNKVLRAVKRNKQHTTSLKQKKSSVVQHLLSKHLLSRANFTQQETTIHNKSEQGGQTIQIFSA